MERADTEQAIIKLVQTQTFPEDIDSLARHRPATGVEICIEKQDSKMSACFTVFYS